jgi:NAD(P)-dependent dehydrogenase (short-subunit alcohol dehydrogenase family)
MSHVQPVALVTGASKGLGAALVRHLAAQGYALVLTARGHTALEQLAASLRSQTDVVALAGDVADPGHVHALVTAAQERFGRIDALINNASTLGPTPLRPLRNVSTRELLRTFEVNVAAPLHLIHHALDLLRASDGVVVNVTSDAAVNAYPTWGAYGTSKAALEHLTAILGTEEPRLRLLLVDPGDMATEMHEAAIPEADPSTLGDPADVAARLAEEIKTARPGFARVALQEAVPA